MPITLPASYTTVEHLYAVLPDIGSATSVTSAQLAGFIGQAQAEMNARLVQAYSLPLTVEVPVLQTLCTDLAIYRLLALRLYTAARLEASPWPDRYKESFDTLGQIAEGKIKLVNSSGEILAGRSDVAEMWSTTKDYVPTYWDGGPEGDQVVDPDKVEDEADRRGLTIRDRLL